MNVRKNVVAASGTMLLVTRSATATGGFTLASGQIKRLARDRGFGFIRPDGESEDVFFHTSAVQGGMFDSLQEGQTVEFEKGADDRDPRKTRAINVRVAS